MLEHHSITTATAALEAAPMSRKKAMLLVLLIDAAIDAGRTGTDVLAHRQAVATHSPALALVMAVAAMREGGARLVVDAVEAPPRGEAEYMVSVYNRGTVPRLMIVADGVVKEALPVLRQAVADLAGT